MGKTQSREQIEAERERKDFQFKMSSLFNKKVRGSEMEPSDVKNIFGQKPIFSEGIRSADLIQLFPSG